MTEHGKPVDFNEDLFIECAKQLVQADEVELALKVLESVPAFYRDNVPPKINDFKNKIFQHMITAHGYLNDNHDNEVCNFALARKVIEDTLRGKLVDLEIRALEKPHVVDCGPGEYWLPVGIQHDFTYNPIALDSRAFAQASMTKRISEKMMEKPREDAPRVFVALEIIEHLSNPTELRWEAAKHFQGRDPDYIHLSTPYYCYDANPKDWSKHKLPHLRCYTPREFFAAATKIWPHFEWQLYLSPVMSLRGLHPDAKNRPALL